MIYYFKILIVKKRKKKILIIWNIIELFVVMVIEFKIMVE